jgi:hypothetical protein
MEPVNNKSRYPLPSGHMNNIVLGVKHPMLNNM